MTMPDVLISLTKLIAWGALFFIGAVVGVSLERYFRPRPRYKARPHPMIFKPQYPTWTFSDASVMGDNDEDNERRRTDPVTVTIKGEYTYESPGPGDIIHRDNIHRYVVLRRSAASYGYLGHQYSLLLSEKSMEHP